MPSDLSSFGFTPRDWSRIRERADALNAELEERGTVAVIPARFEDLDADWHVSVVPAEGSDRWSGRRIGRMGACAVLIWPKEAGRGK